MTAWSMLQLSEYFSAITRAGDVAAAARIAVQQATEATDAELGAVIFGDSLGASVGLGRSPDPTVFTSVRSGTETSAFPVIGDAYVSVFALGEAGERLLVARTDEAFGPDERQMLQGMAKVLGLALRSLRTLAAEQQLRHDREREAESRLVLLQALERRERLLETLLRVQRAAGQGAPLGDLLDSITAGARRLLDDDGVAALVMHDLTDPAQLTVASVAGGASAGRDAVLQAARRAITAGRTVAEGELAAAPVHIGDRVAGAFVVAGNGGDVRDSERRDVLAAFSEQASLALTGAHTQAAMHEAHHDPLTRLPNRALFLQRVEQVLAEDTGAALLYLDLDLFKQVNDTLGHAAGDELLRGVADRLSASVRDTDMAARFGGDEFAVLLEPISSELEAWEIAHRVIDAISEPFDIAGRAVLTRASVGIAYSGAGRTAEHLVEDADLAMYRAKKTKPGTCRAFEPRMRTELLRPAC